MKKGLWIGVCILLLGALFACGVMDRDTAAAPMAQDMEQVRTTLTAFPEELDSITILARTSGTMIRANKNGSEGIFEYRSASGAYRRMEPPVAGNVTAMAAAPDGALWTVIQSEDGCVLLKSSQGNVLIQQTLGNFSPKTILCDNVGHVFAASKDKVERFSPEGELQASIILPAQSEISELQLAANQERVFLRIRRSGEQSVYTELLADMTLGDSFAACSTDWNVVPIGSFLKDYLVMEADCGGLYAYREGSGWETVCLWSAQHLDGTVGKRLIRDANGCGLVQYEKDNQVYCLNLSPS